MLPFGFWTAPLNSAPGATPLWVEFLKSDGGVFIPYGFASSWPASTLPTRMHRLGRIITSMDKARSVVLIMIHPIHMLIEIRELRLGAGAFGRESKARKGT
jgi:hypothetical protein